MTSTPITTTTADPFAEVTVYAGTLQVAAQQLQELAEFFGTHPAAREQLGRFLAERDPDATNARIEGILTAFELAEAAEFLSALAGIDQKG